MHQHKQIGSQAEQQALIFLQQQNLRLIKQNFYSRFGEIDLIMQDGDTLVFVEVKHRKAGINDALESMNITKQRKLIRTAQYYLLKVGREINCRFDAIVIGNNQELQWLKNIIML